MHSLRKTFISKKKVQRVYQKFIDIKTRRTIKDLLLKLINKKKFYTAIEEEIKREHQERIKHLNIGTLFFSSSVFCRILGVYLSY